MNRNAYFAVPLAALVVLAALLPTYAAEPSVQGSVTVSQPQTLSTTAEKTESVTTTVQTAPVLAAADYLDIQYAPGNTKYKLQEYSLTVRNKQPRHIELLQVEVPNGLSEQAYAQIQQEKSQARRRLAGGMLRGLTSVATSFVPYAGLGSMAAYQALAVGSHAATATANMVENTHGTVDYTGRIVQHASNVLISPNQQFQCLAVVPQNQTPSVKVIFKDLQTNQIYDLQK